MSSTLKGIRDGSIAREKVEGGNRTVAGEQLVTIVENAATNSPLGGDLSGTVADAQIVAGAVGATELASNAVTTVKITDLNVTQAKIALGAVDTGQLADSGVTDGKIGNRTLDDSVAPTSNTAQLGTLLGWIINRLKAITGKSDWKTAPAITLESLSAHHARHESGGADAIKLDDLATPDDNTDLNATSGRHGLLPKLSGSASDVLLGDGTFGTPPAGSDVNTVKLLSANQSIPTGNTVASTTTETTFSSTYTVAAGVLYVGCVIRVKLWGLLSTDTSTVNLTIKIKFGGTTLVSTGAILMPSSLSAKQWSLDSSFICFASGGSGSLEAQGEFRFDNGSGGRLHGMGGAGVTIATTVSNALTVTAQWGTSSASNTITMRQFQVEIIKM